MRNKDGYEFKILESGTIEEVIELAKSRYNIFSNNPGKLYTEMCNKIKARLDDAGLDYEIVRPE